MSGSVKASAFELVRVRISGSGESVNDLSRELAGVLRDRVVEMSSDYANERETGIRRYLSVLVRYLSVLVMKGLYCGLRPTEYLALRWQDLNLEADELRVTQNVHRVRNDYVGEHMGKQVHGFRFGPTKTHRSRRTVAVPRFLIEVLRQWRANQETQKVQTGPVWTDLDLVFTDARGYPHVNDRVRRAFYQALETAKVRKVVLFALRHTSATLTLAATKDLKLVATRLGHANETMVLRVYGHVMPGADQKAAGLLAELVKRKGTDDRCNTNATRQPGGRVEE